MCSKGMEPSLIESSYLKGGDVAYSRAKFTTLAIVLYSYSILATFTECSKLSVVDRSEKHISLTAQKFCFTSANSCKAL